MLDDDITRQHIGKERWHLFHPVTLCCYGNNCLCYLIKFNIHNFADDNTTAIKGKGKKFIGQAKKL